MLACSAVLIALLQMAGSVDKASGGETSVQQQTVASTTEVAGDGNAQQSPEPTKPNSPNPETGWYKVPPMPSTNGTPGVYTVETAESLPKGVFAATAYTNKFGRAPGSVTILDGGFTIAGGITKKLTAFLAFDPYIHIHLGEASQLSLNKPPGCPHDVFKAPIYCGVNDGPLKPQSWHGPAASYVAGYPYAARDTTDFGPVTVGAKFNFYSETRGDPLSVSLGGAMIIPTESTAHEYANFGAQSGTLDFSITLALSKTLWKEVVLANNVTYLITRNPHIGNQTLYTPADVIIFGQGFIFRSQHRLQFITEYTCEMQQEGHAFGVIGIDTENTSLGPSDPVDGVWGARWYFLDSAALDVGYRYMLNLHQINDRSGFSIKISKVFGWKKH